MPKLNGQLNRKERRAGRVCARKRLYTDWLDALKAAHEYHHQFGNRQTPYLCNICNGIHLTTSHNNDYRLIALIIMLIIGGLAWANGIGADSLTFLEGQ